MMDEEKFEKLKVEYKKNSLRKFLFIAICLIFMFIAMGVSITVGAYTISVERVYEVIWNHILGMQYEPYSQEWYDDFIVWDNRLPRVLFAIVAGVGLAVSGVTMQSLMKNPLAEPYTTGVSSGAYLGVAMAMALSLTLIPGHYGTTINAFVFAMIPVVIILLFSSRLGDSVATIILIGTALTYMFNAFSTLILVSTDSETLSNVYKWQVGTIFAMDWADLALVSVIVFAGSIIIMFLSKKLNIMTMGDENAKSLGVNVKRMRIVCMIVMALIVATIVSYAGIIGFIGLICPHIIRLIIGSDNRFVLPAASAFGAAFLLFSDLIAKYISDLDTVPVGVICSFIGAPMFLFILIRNRRGIW
ncbi:MAG: iron ABC transporter permease [Candidatus Methanomethylophilaceae archaeon]|nr:iron ABC transporter permease [Candidatus Methanomethylophilaceae archaeon]